MNQTLNMAWNIPSIPTQHVAVGYSAVQDCRGYDNCRIWVQKFNTNQTGNKNPKIIFRLRHFTASATYASATAFSTVLAASSAAASTTRAIGFDVAMNGVGPWLVAVASHATGSGVSGIFAQPYNGKYVPTGTATTGISGFASLTFSPAQP